MLQSRYRLRRSADLKQVWQHGRTWRHPTAILLAQPNELGVSRFAFVASRRVGNAVVRNRRRRLLREAVRHRIDAIEPGWDCIFVARRLRCEPTFAETETAVTNLLKRARLLQS